MNCKRECIENLLSFCFNEASSSSLIVGRTRLFTDGHRAFPVAAARIWNSLPWAARHFCTFVACLPVAPQDSSLHHFLSQSVTMYSASAVTLVISDTLIVHVTYLLTYFGCCLDFTRHSRSRSRRKAG